MEGNSTYGIVGLGGETGYTIAELGGPDRMRGKKGRPEIAVSVIGAAKPVCKYVEEHVGNV